MSWFNKWILLSVAALLLTLAFFELTETDIIVQNLFYDFDAGSWIVDRNNRILKFLLYDGIKNIYIVMVLVTLTVQFFFRDRKILQPYRQGVLIFCLSIILVPATINIAKAITTIPCPNDLIQYGGEYPHATLFAPIPDEIVLPGNIRCYPAGHASGGFALMALFFLFNDSNVKRVGLASGLTLGWTVGFYKMLIGDHFLSHTLVTMLLAWLLILVIARSVYRANNMTYG